MLDGTRIIIPDDAVKDIVNELHRAHSGTEKMYKTASQLYYWQGMKNSIRQKLDGCSSCMESRPRQTRPTVTMRASSAAIEPMRHMGIDLFDAAGSQWVALVDRFSGYAWTKKLKSTNTSAILKQLSKWFTEYGWPSNLRSDGGPQFRTEFSQYCKDNNIKHELASPYNPESNGLAEAAVKNLKAIIIRCNEKGEDTKLAIAAWRNMARTDGQSPSQLFFGRRQKQQLPMISAHSRRGNRDLSGRDKTAAAAEKHRNAHTHDLGELQPGTKARMQHHITNRWDKCVTVESRRPNGHAYTCLLYTSPSPRDLSTSRMPSSA